MRSVNRTLMKRFFLFSLIQTVRAIIACNSFIQKVFLFFYRPIGWCIKKVFWPAILFLYKRQLFIKQRWALFSHSAHTIIAFFTHRFAIFFGVLTLSCTMIVFNFYEKANASYTTQFANQSLLASIAFPQTDIIVTKDHIQGTEQNFFTSDAVLIDRPVTIQTGKLGESPVIHPYNIGIALQTADGITKTEKTRTEIEEYVVQEGDTASSIANKFNLSIQTILDANDLKSPDLITPNQTLRILPVNGVAHTVKKDESLKEIAKKYGVTEKEIREFNKIDATAKREKGETLIIPNGEIPTPAAVTGVAVTGVLPATTTTYTGGHIWPTTATNITSHYGYRWGGFHTGTDIAGTLGDPVWASAPGTVVASGWNSTGYGNMVLIDHGNGIQTRYGHLNSIAVSYGQVVSQGQEIGKEGTTGWSTGPHLHYECIISGATVNPLGNCL